MSHSIRAFFAIALVSAFAEAYACQPCTLAKNYKSLPSVRFNNADTVFIGTVLTGESALKALIQSEWYHPSAIEREKQRNQALRDDTLIAGTVLFAVEKVFKGKPGGRTTVWIGSPIIFHSCHGTNAELNKRYIVYAERSEEDNKLYSDKCHGVLPEEDSQEDMAFLQNLPPAGTGGNIQGEVRVKDKPVVGAKVKISQNRRLITSVRTNGNGFFEAKKLKPGTYQLEAEVQKKYLDFTFENNPYTEELIVKDRGTAWVVLEDY